MGLTSLTVSGVTTPVVPPVVSLGSVVVAVVTVDDGTVVTAVVVVVAILDGLPVAVVPVTPSSWPCPVVPAAISRKLESDPSAVDDRDGALVDNETGSSTASSMMGEEEVGIDVGIGSGAGSTMTVAHVGGAVVITTSSTTGPVVVGMVVSNTGASVVVTGGWVEGVSVSVSVSSMTIGIMVGGSTCGIMVGEGSVVMDGDDGGGFLLYPGNCAAIAGGNVG